MGTDVKLIDYINSLKGLTNQQKSQIAESATSFEDVSIMLKAIKGDVSAGKKDGYENSVWQSPAATGCGDCLVASSTQAASEPSKKQPEIPQDKGNFFESQEQERKENFTVVEKSYHNSGAIKELTQKEYKNRKISKENVKSYDEQGNVVQEVFSEYDDKKLLQKETTQTYDKKGELMFKKSVSFTYNPDGSTKEETGENYDKNDKPIKSYVKNYQQNEKGVTVKSTTQNYDSQGNTVSSEVENAEVVQKQNLKRLTKSVCDKNGNVFAKSVDDTIYNKKGEKTKTYWQYYEKGNLVKQSVSEFDKQGAQVRTTDQRYDNGLIKDRTIEEGCKINSVHFEKGKIEYKIVTQNKFDERGNLVSETVVKTDAEGNFAGKKVINKKFDGSGKETEISVENYDEKNKSTGKTVNSIQYDDKGLRKSQNSESYDSFGNLISRTAVGYKTEHEINFLSSQVKTNYKDGKISSVETVEPSEVKGEYKYKREDASGNVVNFVDVQKSEGGINIAKNFESPDGTRTSYQYSEDDKGNKKLVYKIMDKDNKVLMSTERDYQRINDKLAISKVDSKEYRIETEGDEIKVFDVNSKKYTVIDLNKFVAGDNPELKTIIKSQPGDVLVGLSKEVNKIGTDYNNGSYSQDEEYMTLDNMPATVAHEFGHSIDSAPDETGKNTFKIAKNKEFQAIFKQEQENFKNSATEAEGYSFSYLEDLHEFVAETKVLTTARGDKEWNSMREIVLMKYFPKSIAYATKMLKETEESDRIKKAF